MAYKNVNSVTDGSFLRGGHIYNAYVYGPNWNSLMDSSVVVHEQKIGTPIEISKITVTTMANYHDYYVDIN